ncbi:MAG: DegT/DnrJ/EryC1/StrS family aminotransferase, partial [Planctomycetia bacterium]|nr:DegT/DnrJ/EryC1/StrS family aminotransferase [Planctomycetia bacterium]
HGSQWAGKGAGTLGTFGSFSFQRSKLLNCGEGGALLMQDEDLYHKIDSLRICGRETGGVRVHSGNFRATSFQGAILRGQLSALRKNAPVMNRNGLALDKAVAAAPGVKPLRRNKHINRQTGYGFAFVYDKEAFDGLSGDAFRRALWAEVGVMFGGTYTPLHHSELYSPQMKKRHKLSKSYIKAITPSRWKLPVTEELWKNRAVVSGWPVYACPTKRANLLTDAIAKIHEHRSELLANE